MKLRVLPTGERRDQIAEKMCSSLDRRGNGPEVFVHATLRSRATAIFQDGIQLLNCRPYRDFGMSPSFYLHPVNQLMDAVAWAEIAYKHCAYPGPAPQCAMLFYSLPADWKTHNPNGWELQLGVPADVDAWKQLVAASRSEKQTASTDRADQSPYVLGPIASRFPTPRRIGVMPEMFITPMMQLALKQQAATYFNGFLSFIWAWQPPQSQVGRPDHDDQ